MNRFLNILPILGIVAYMTVGGFFQYQLQVMQIACVVALFVIVPSAYYLVRRGSPSAIVKSIVVFIVLSTVCLWLLPVHIAVIASRFSVALLYIVLFLFAIGPILLGREPFTVYFAKKSTPPAVWETDIFKKINFNMTLVWAGIFAACAVSAGTPGLLFTSDAMPSWTVVFETIVPFLFLLGIGLPFTKFYPDYYQRKLGLTPMTASSVELSQAEKSKPATLRSSSYPEKTKEVAMDRKPKVVAINGSPHEGAANTSMMIGMLQDNLEKEGFELEQIILSQHQIHYCYGCAVCLEKGNCWIKDDYKAISQKLLDADAVILGSPVYVLNVTAQMKTFLDRSLGFGHRPRKEWKPGLALCVSAGLEEVAVSRYLSSVLRIFGAFSVGEFTAIAVGPGQFLGKEAVQARAADLAGDLVRAVREKRRYPANSDDRNFWQFMGWLVHENRDLMKADHEHWDAAGLYDSFEKYVGQTRDPGIGSPEMRQNWIKKLMKKHFEANRVTPKEEKTGPQQAGTARELLEMMPKGFNPDAADGMTATYQFEVSGAEDFVAHLKIENKAATFHEGPADKPNVTIKTPADVWLSIARGELDGAQAFMSGKYKVEGDLGLLMKMESLFKRS